MSRSIFYFLVLLLNSLLPSVDPSDEDEFSPVLHKLNEEERRRLHLLKSDPANRKFLNAMFKLGFEVGNEKGYEKGYENGTAQHFNSMFDCVITHGKADLEVYKDYQYIWSECEKNSAMQYLGMHEDMISLIIKNDQWIDDYEKIKISNGYFSTTSTTTSPNKKPRIKTLKVLKEIENLSRHWYCIVNYTGTQSFTSTNAKPSNIGTISRTQLPSPSVKPDVPPFITKLQQKLKEIRIFNPGKYSTDHEIFLRFSVCSARTYKMFCTFRHKVDRYVGEMIEKNSTVQFSDVLFYYTKCWMMTREQLLFFNVVRRILRPGHAPIKNITVLNKNPLGGEFTIIPYDDSNKCNQIIGYKQPTVEVDMETIKDYELPTR